MNADLPAESEEKKKEEEKTKVETRNLYLDRKSIDFCVIKADRRST